MMDPTEWGIVNADHFVDQLHYLRSMNERTLLCFVTNKIDAMASQAQKVATNQRELRYDLATISTTLDACPSGAGPFANQKELPLVSTSTSPNHVSSAEPTAFVAEARKLPETVFESLSAVASDDSTPTSRLNRNMMINLAQEKREDEECNSKFDPELQAEIINALLAKVGVSTLRNRN